MAARRVNPNLVKLHRSYSAVELAALLGVHKNTVRNWQKQGLQPLDLSRPTIFEAADVRAFLKTRNAVRKRPCPPGTIYCCRCREPRAPAGGMVDYVEVKRGKGNLRALCVECEALVNRRVRREQISAVMPGFTVQITVAE
jgi:hypothetical protein